ncbi:hypothetical protein ACLB2K_031623 [Fragaria x ananassa]
MSQTDRMASDLSRTTLWKDASSRKLPDHMIYAKPGLMSRKLLFTHGVHDSSCWSFLIQRGHESGCESISQSKAVRSHSRLQWHQIPTNRIVRGSINQGSSDSIDKDDKLDSRSRVQLARFSSMESLKNVETRSSKKNKKLEFDSSRVSPVPNGGSLWGALNISKSFNPVFGSSKKFFSASVPGSRVVSSATSPISRRPSPPRSTTPTPTLGGLTSPKIAVDDSAKRTNESLSQEVIKLRAQVETLARKAQLQEVELERTTKQLKEAIAIAGAETAKRNVAKEVIQSLIAQQVLVLIKIKSSLHGTAVLDTTNKGIQM